VNFVCISVALQHPLAWENHFINARQQELLSVQHFRRTVCLLEKLNAGVEALQIVDKLKDWRLELLSVSWGFYMFSCVVLLTITRVKICFFKDRQVSII